MFPDLSFKSSVPRPLFQLICSQTSPLTYLFPNLYFHSSVPIPLLQLVCSKTSPSTLYHLNAPVLQKKNGLSIYAEKGWSKEGKTPRERWDIYRVSKMACNSVDQSIIYQKMLYYMYPRKRFFEYQNGAISCINL